MRLSIGPLALLVAFAFAATSTARAQERDLTFAITEGVTYQATPKDIRDKFAPLAAVLGKAAGRQVRMVVVPAYDDLRAGLQRREYDIAFVHPAHVALAEVKADRYTTLAWTTGYTEYTVSLMTTAAEPVKAIGDLKGRTLVTPDPDSITAAMVRAMFRAERLPLSTDKAVVPTAVRVITTRYQDAVPFYIDNGFAEVGATAANAVVKAWTDKGGKVLAKSRPVPIKQLIVSTTVPAATQTQLRQALLTLRDTKPGREALEVLGYKGFVAPNAEIERASIAWLGL